MFTYSLTSYVRDIFETLLIDKLIALIALVAFTLSLIFIISFGDLANFRVTCTLSLKIGHRTLAFSLSYDAVTFELCIPKDMMLRCFFSGC